MHLERTRTEKLISLTVTSNYLIATLVITVLQSAGITNSSITQAVCYRFNHGTHSYCDFLKEYVLKHYSDKQKDMGHKITSKAVQFYMQFEPEITNFFCSMANQGNHRIRKEAIQYYSS